MKSFFEKWKAEQKEDWEHLKTMPPEVLKKSSNWAFLAVVLMGIALAVLFVSVRNGATWGGVGTVVLLLVSGSLARRKANEIVWEWEDRHESR